MLINTLGTLPKFAGCHRVGFAIFEPFYFDRMVTRHVTLQSGRVSFFGGNRSCSGGEQRRSCRDEQSIFTSSSLFEHLYHISFAPTYI